MTAFFKQKAIKAHPTGKGEKGPDFYIDGSAVEVKGSKFSSERLMEQLVTNAYREKEAHLALPIQAFSAKLLIQLYILGGAINEILGKFLKLYLVSQLGEFYYVKEYYDVRIVVPQGLNHIKAISSFAQLVDRPLGLKGKTPEIEAKRVAQSLARAVNKVDVAVRQLLGEEMKQQSYTMVHRNMLEQA